MTSSTESGPIAFRSRLISVESMVHPVGRNASVHIPVHRGGVVSESLPRLD